MNTDSPNDSAMDTTARRGAELAGCMTALVTPFDEGEIDWTCLGSLVDRQIDAGVDWLVACSTTGEVPTLTPEERRRTLDAIIERSAGRCGVLAGTGSNNTSDTIVRTKEAVGAGADAVMLVAPYYNRPTGEGLYRHFAAVADAVDLPMVLYNIPVRTGVEISIDVIVRLREDYPHIVAVKHATGCIVGASQLLNRCDIALLSGDDSLTWPLMSVGAVGVISAMSNLAPSLMKSLVTAFEERDFASGLEYHKRVFDLAESIGRFGPNPLPVKTAMAVAGLIREEFRLPLCRLEVEARAKIEAVVRRYELL